MQNKKRVVAYTLYAKIKASPLHIQNSVEDMTHDSDLPNLDELYDLLGMALPIEPRTYNEPESDLTLSNEQVEAMFESRISQISLDQIRAEWKRR